MNDSIQVKTSVGKKIPAKVLIGIIGTALFLLALILFFNSSNTYVQSVMNMLLYNIVIVLGLNYITGLTGQMNLATAGMVAMGAYTYGIMTTSYGWEPWMALFALFALALAMGLGLGYPSLRLKGFFLSLTTIGFSEVVRLLASNLAELTGGTMGFSNIVRLPFFIDQTEKNSYFYLNLVITVVLVLVAFSLVNSKWGRAFKAIRDNADAAEASGIDVSKLKIQAFTLASVYAVIGGCMYAGYNTYLNPSAFTVQMSQNYVAMLMIGGLGSVPGNIIGATLVTVLPEMLRKFDDYYWIVFSTVCLVMAILVPEGLWAQLVRLYKFAVKKISGRKNASEKAVK